MRNRRSLKHPIASAVLTTALLLGAALAGRRATAQTECPVDAWVYSTFGEGREEEVTVYAVPGGYLRVDLHIWYQLGQPWPDRAHSPTLVMFTPYQQPDSELSLVDSGELVQDGEPLCHETGTAFPGFCLRFFPLPRADDEVVTVEPPISSFLFKIPEQVSSEYRGYVRAIASKLAFGLLCRFSRRPSPNFCATRGSCSGTVEYFPLACDKSAARDGFRPAQGL